MIGYPAEKSVFLSGFVQGQGQKSEQKHETKKLVEFHSLHLLTMPRQNSFAAILKNRFGDFRVIIRSTAANQLREFSIITGVIILKKKYSKRKDKRGWMQMDKIAFGQS